MGNHPYQGNESVANAILIMLALMVGSAPAVPITSGETSMRPHGLTGLLFGGNILKRPNSLWHPRSVISLRNG